MSLQPPIRAKESAIEGNEAYMGHLSGEVDICLFAEEHRSTGSCAYGDSLHSLRRR